MKSTFKMRHDNLLVEVFAHVHLDRSKRMHTLAMFLFIKNYSALMPLPITDLSNGIMNNALQGCPT